MEELTLTGATLTSDDGPLIELSQAKPSLGGSHSHNHSHGRPCCNSPQPMLVHAPPPNIPVEEVLSWEPPEIYNRLADIVRRGTYELLEPIVTGLEAKGPDSMSAVLDRVDDEGPSLLHWAAKRVDDVRFLSCLCKHSSPESINMPSNDKVGMMPLHWAATEGSVPHAATLLRYGANLEGRDKSGCTPLLIAAQYGHVEMVAYMLQKGANGKAVDSSFDTALHWAAYKGSIQVCGLLLFREELSWTDADKFGQTPLHLASLRGHTSVVRYLLQEGTRQERKQVLYLKDTNGKTPLDLAIKRNRPNVESVLRDAMDAVEHQRDVKRYVKTTLRQLCSLHAWQIWMGIHSMNDEVDEFPKFPFYFTLFHVALATAWYPLVFLPVKNMSQGVLWDLMWWNCLNIMCLVALWFCLYKTYTTDPGTLEKGNPQTEKLQRLYEETLESYSDEESFAKHKTPLCHTCHVVKPLRSKHCRVQRRCVLLFDHHCPFVGNTIGLNNYKWFYLVLLFMSFAVIGFLITFGIYMHRQPQLRWGLLFGGIYVGIFLIPSGGMLIYHTQLMMVNLSTNEHQNVRRYKYLFNEQGQYKNPFFRGWLNNVHDRFFPTESSYTLPDTEQALQPLVERV